MSASTEKKLRQAAREAGTDKKTLAAQEEAKKKAKSNLRWTIGAIAIVLLIAFILFINSSFLYTRTTALAVGDKKYSPAEMSYYYANDYVNYINGDGYYYAVLGMIDTSSGLTGLRSQECPILESGTWKDYFLQMAEDDMIRVKALTDYAAANGITLTEEEIAQVDDGFAGVDDYAKAQGFSGADGFMAANYGPGVTYAMVRQASLDNTLANKTYEQKQDETTYTAEELESYYQSLDGEADSYSYAYYYLEAALEEDADTPTEEAMAETRAQADAIVYAYKDGDDIEDLAERFDAAIDSQTGETGESAVTVNGGRASALNTYFKDWLTNTGRTAGDITVADSSTGCYVVLFLDHSDNHYNTANVRHILIKAEADEDGNYTDEALAAAKARAEEILAEYEAGEKTEESFATLAEVYSEDSGSNTNGGLYENVAKGQMVPEFDAFCFEGHKSGDTAIVYGNNGGYAGYHVMYYVGEGPLYSETIARTLLLSEDMDAWEEDLISAYAVREGFGLRFVG